MMLMARLRSDLRMPREGLTRGLALVCLLMMGGFVVAGPSGVLAWGENQRMLVERHAEIDQLLVERDNLRNRVALLDPRNADPDFAGELLRSHLNVVHPDEMVMLLDPKVP
jgi:cell division protein FtsB